MFALVIGSLFLLVRGFRALNFDLDSPERHVAIWAYVSLVSRADLGFFTTAKLEGENPSDFLRSQNRETRLDDFVIQSEARNLHFPWVWRPSVLRVRVIRSSALWPSLLARRQEILRVELEPLARRL
jgi:hypothetical protein